MRYSRQLRIREAKIGPIQVAKNRLGKDDDTHRAVLERVAGTQSAKELNEETFVAIMQKFGRYGSDAPDARANSPSCRHLKSPT